MAPNGMTARVVILNGAGSAGKSSIARALQAVTSEPFLHFKMDAFLEMLPSTLQDHPDTFTFKTVYEEGRPAVVIIGGPVGARAMHGMRHAAAAMAGQGNNLIVDDVLCDGEMPEYQALLAKFDLYLVGVHTPLDVLEEREGRRGDRMIGLARWQFDRVHRGIVYDLEIDTSRLPPDACAVLIKQKFRL